MKPTTLDEDNIPSDVIISCIMTRRTSSKNIPLDSLFLSVQGEAISAVGYVSSPWQVQAELISPPSGVSLLQDTVPYVNGTATFSQLMVSGVGTGLRLRFTVTQPNNVSFSVEMPGSFDVTRKTRLVLKSPAVSGRVDELIPLSPLVKLYMEDAQVGRDMDIASPMGLRCEPRDTKSIMRETGVASEILHLTKSYCAVSHRKHELLLCKLFLEAILQTSHDSLHMALNDFSSLRAHLTDD